MNRIIYTIFKTLAVLFVLFIFLSISALAQSFTLRNILLLVVSVICLNKCCDIFENYLDENGVCIVCDDADEEQDRKANESGAMLYGMEYWHLVEDVEFRVNHINAQYKLFTVFDIVEAFDKLLISKKLGDFVPSGENRYRLYEKILSCLRSVREEL